jgi:inner membrane protein
MAIRRNRPRLTHFAGLLVVKHLVTLAFGVLLISVSSFAVEPARGRQDLTMRATRPGASQPTAEFAQCAPRGQLDPPPRGSSVFDQKAARRFDQSCKDEPVTRPAHSATYGVGVETESVGKMTNSGSSPPMALSSSLPPFLSSALLANRSRPLAAETWFIAGAVLLLGAILLPGAAVLCFFGLAGFLVGGASVHLELTWQSQFIAYAMSVFALVLVWLWLEPPSPDRNGLTNQTLRGGGPCAFVGRVLRLEKPIVDGLGMVTIGGTLWRVAGRDCAAGKHVKVVYAEGTLLIVDPLEN